ncbi:MAG: hypothetical protein M9932_00760 [Xanthobacteraceae bacterium]|nr:hypothetical protein [Xanthobacteraceae bacterium]
MAVRRMAARPWCRVSAAAVLIAVAGALAGCTSNPGDFDPGSLLDGFDTKKKLPGNREPVFPGGVPGLEQGVPRELYKENVDRQQLQGQEAVPVEPAPPPAAEAPKPRAPSRSRAAAHPRPAAPTAATPAAPKSAPRTVHRRSTTVPPPDTETPAAAPQAQPQAAPPAASSNPFPAPLPSGSFQRQ